MNPPDVHGLQAVGLTPSLEEAEQFHMDEKLMNIKCLKAIVDLTPPPEKAEPIHIDDQVFVNALDVVGLLAIVGSTLPSKSPKEAILVHVNEQSMNIVDDLEETKLVRIDDSQ